MMAIGTGLALALGTGASSLFGAVSAKKAADAQVESADRAGQLQYAAANRAADLQLQGMREQIAAQQDMQNQVIGLTGTSRAIGENALMQLMDQAQQGYATAAPFEADPGYQFRRDQALGAMDAGASARGMYLSGAALKERGRYADGLAAQEYGNWDARQFRNYSTKKNELLNIANLGRGAMGQQIGAIQSGAGNIGNALASGYSGAGNAYMAGGQAQGNALMQMGQARAAGIGGINDAIQGGLQNGAGLLGMYQSGYFNNGNNNQIKFAG